MKIKDLTGKIFGKLTVIERAENGLRNQARWTCRCECGILSVKQSTHLIEGLSKSCGRGNCRYRSGKDSYNYTGYKDLSGSYYYKVTCHAKEKGREMNVSIKEMWDQFEQQHGLCALTGRLISLTDHTASLDRIDSSKGYVIGNIQWLHKDINALKNDFPEDVFVSMCVQVAEFTKGKQCLGKI